jgi:hypothetical protein
MRFRLLRRRLTISAPTMAIRSHAPWPIKWVFTAVVLGFCAAIGLWAFELGKDLAGLDSNAKEELTKLRIEVKDLRADLGEAQSVANTAQSAITMEKTAQEKLVAQVKQLEGENRQLRDDLGFFERLLPAGSGAQALAIRGLQAEVLGGGSQIKWQALVMQAAKNAPEFNGQLDITLSGLQNGKPWSAPLPGPASPALKFTQYQRLEGVADLPEQTVVKSLTVRVLSGNVQRAVQTIKL